MPEVYVSRHEPDHIIATQHRGPTSSENLALACFDCNRRKGPNLSSVDPETTRIVQLFNPRRDNWRNTFAWMVHAFSGSPQGVAPQSNCFSSTRRNVFAFGKSFSG